MDGQVVSMAVNVGTCEAKHKDVDNQIADCKEDSKRVETNVDKLFDKLDDMNIKINTWNFKLWLLVGSAVITGGATIIIQLTIK